MTIPEASCTTERTSWRVRDAAEALLLQRGLFSTSITEGALDHNEKNDPPKEMVLSRSFDVETCQARLRRDKAPLVRQALDAAASAILENLHKADDDYDNDELTGEEKSDPSQHQRLPPILADIAKLQKMRVASMERANANKDLSRRRIAVAKEQEEERQLKTKLSEKTPSKNGSPKKPSIGKEDPAKAAGAAANDAQKVSTQPGETSQKASATTNKVTVKSEALPEEGLEKPSESSRPAPAAAVVASMPNVESTVAASIASPDPAPSGIKIKSDATNVSLVPDATRSSGEEPKPAAVKPVSFDLKSHVEPTGTKSPSKPTPSESKEEKPSVVSSQQPTTVAPKFTRNTPAASASALESRVNGSRAILCGTANMVFHALTPPLPGWETIDVADIPQNPKKAESTVATKSPNQDISKSSPDPTSASSDKGRTSNTVPNIENVIAESKKLGQRIENVVTNAARRAKRRHRFRMDNLRFDSTGRDSRSSRVTNRGFQIIENPFAWKDDSDEDEGSVDNGQSYPMELDETVSVVTAENLPSSDNHNGCVASFDVWSKVCIPRLLKILRTGAGNAILHDTQWATRHRRIANLFQEIAMPSKEGIPFGMEKAETSNSSYGLHLIVTVGPDVDRFAREFKGVNSHLRLLSTVDEGSLRALPYKGNKDERRRLRQRFRDATGLSDSPFHVIITSYSDFLKDYIHFCQTPFEVVLLDDGASWMAAAQNDPNSPIGSVWNEALFSKNDHQMGLAGSFLKDWDYSKEKIDDEATKDAWIGLTARHRLVTSSVIKKEPSKAQTEPLPVSGLVGFVLPHFADTVREEWDRSRICNDVDSMGHFRKLLTRSIVVHDPTTTDETQETDLLALAMKVLKGDLPESIRSTNDPAIPYPITDDRFVADGKVASSRRHALQWLGCPETSWLRYELGAVSLEPILAATRVSMMHGHICEEIATASLFTTGATGQIIGTLAFKPAIRCGKSFGSEQGLRQHLSTHHAPPGTWLCRTCKADCVTSQARTHHERSCGQAKSTSITKNESATISADGSSKKETGKKGGKPGKASGIKDEKNADGTVRGPSTSGLGGGVVPALSVINIKDLPPDVKPLLRDPRQTSRTGGNSKRHVYAYRGVCRQARKGHDRWQSQISFLGVNHYLGTFDSEWDAAAIYAWAHLILYGEEATRQAQKEGEEAAAAYEQERKDIAAGKIPVTSPKADKKSKKGSKKKGSTKSSGKKGKQTTEASTETTKSGSKRKLGRSKQPSDDVSASKQPPSKRAKTTASSKEDISQILAKSVGKSTILAPMPKFIEMSDDELAKEAAVRMVAARSVNYCITEVSMAAPIHLDFRPCIPRTTIGSSEQMGGALLVGLDPSLFGWSIDEILSDQYFGSDSERKNATTALTAEFGKDGLNQRFRSLLQGSTTVIGCASSRMKRVYASMGMGTPPLGGPIGRIDCNTGGNSKCCSETAACIRYEPTDVGDFQFSALSNDLITMNGQRITPEMGSFPLFNEDVCTIGSRVFVFLMPINA